MVEPVPLGVYRDSKKRGWDCSDPKDLARQKLIDDLIGDEGYFIGDDEGM